MIKIENVEVFGWEAAIRGMRNPMNSWEKSDSGWKANGYHIGPNDQKLMMTLAQNGSTHAKYRRMIMVSLDVNAPLYWWKEADTYKVGTVCDSCSTMHKIQAKEFSLEDFSHEHLTEDSRKVLETVIEWLNHEREEFREWNDKEDWWQMIQLLPSSYNQRRTLLLNYEVLSRMYHDRREHKLDEWRKFCQWIEHLPHSELITG